MSASKILTPSRARDKLANTARSKGKFAPETLDARRELAEAKILAYVDRVVAAAPPLSAERRNRLATLVRVRLSDSSEAAAK